MKKKFDAVEMKNDIQAAMYAEMKGMTPKARLQYIRRRAAEFRKLSTDGRRNRKRPQGQHAA